VHDQSHFHIYTWQIGEIKQKREDNLAYKTYFSSFIARLYN
jgi:hypothetical protein